MVISSGGKKDPEVLRRYHLTRDQEKGIRKAFRKPDEQPKILIVTEKLLTGYDVPILYCMYLDKPMRDHVLLQAIARVNRPYEDDEGRRKSAGFVLDFVGIFDKLEKALAFDSEDVQAVVEGLDVLKQRFEMLIGEEKAHYLGIISGKSGDKAAEAILEYFRDQERRQTFYKEFQELQDMYEIISPDAWLRPFIWDFNELGRMYRLVRANYERGIVVDKDFLRKTARLVQEHTESSDIQAPEKLHKLDAETLEKIAGSDKPDTVKIFNLLNALHQYVAGNARIEPYLISIGDKAEQIARAFEQRQQTTKETLEALERLVREMRQAQKQRADVDLSPEAFAVYWYLQKEGVEKADEVARNVASAFEQHPHWQTSAHQEKEVRVSLYKAFISAGIDGVVDFAKNVMRMLRRAS